MDHLGEAVRVTDYSVLKPGTLLRRKNRDKDQQGIVCGMTGDGSIILADVIDLAEGSYVAEKGELKPTEDDEIYAFVNSTANSPLNSRVMEVIGGSSLLKSYPEIRTRIIKFVASLYTPEQILHFQKNDNLNKVFVPVQQKFKIGRFEEKTDWKTVRTRLFKEKLDSMRPGDHITYIALIPPSPHMEPMFYSGGTVPHQETHRMLDGEQFSFKPTSGGHVKLVNEKGGVKTFMVDAGSNYIGRGVKTSFAAAESVAKALYRLYSGYYFIPVEGRGAYGTQQSY